MCLHNDVFCCSFLWYSRGTVLHPTNNQLDVVLWVEACQCWTEVFGSKNSNLHVSWMKTLCNRCKPFSDMVSIFNFGSHCHSMWWKLQGLGGSKIWMMIVMEPLNIQMYIDKQEKKGLNNWGNPWDTDSWILGEYIVKGVTVYVICAVPPFQDIQNWPGQCWKVTEYISFLLITTAAFRLNLLFNNLGVKVRDRIFTTAYQGDLVF